MTGKKFESVADVFKAAVGELEKPDYDEMFLADPQNNQAYKQAIAGLNGLEAAIDNFARKHSLDWDTKDNMRDLVIDMVFSNASR